MARLLAAVLILAFLLVPAADAGTSTARQALKIAKRADERSKRALTDASAALAATRIVVKGADGATGVAGSNGRDGAQGAAGLPGLPGAPGGPVAVTTGTNAATVQIGAEFTTREEVLATAGFTAEGRVVVIAEGQIVEVRNAPTPMTCVIRLDGSDVETREFDLPAHGRELVSLVASPTVDAGGHSARLVCWRTDGRTDAVAEFPAQRARIVVLSG